MPDPLIRRLLVPLDGSPRGERALAYAARLAPPLGAGVTLLRVVAAGEVAVARRYLEETAAKSGGAAFEVRTGDPAREILDAERDGDLVVMVSRGESGHERFWLGGVADRVVRYGRAPVFLARASGPTERTLAPILVPLDGSETAAAVLPWARRFAHAFAAPLELLWITHTSPFEAIAYPPEFQQMTVEWERKEGARYLAEVAAGLERDGLHARGEVREGEPSSVIVETGREAGMIAMTTRGRGGLARSVLGSVASRVAERATVPLLLVRA